VSKREAALAGIIIATIFGWALRALGNYCWEWKHLKVVTPPDELIGAGSMTIIIGVAVLNRVTAALQSIPPVKMTSLEQYGFNFISRLAAILGHTLEANKPIDGESLLEEVRQLKHPFEIHNAPKYGRPVGPDWRCPVCNSVNANQWIICHTCDRPRGDVANV
jgi:hypothetical protein